VNRIGMDELMESGNETDYDDMQEMEEPIFTELPAFRKPPQIAHWDKNQHNWTPDTMFSEEEAAQYLRTNVSTVVYAATRAPVPKKLYYILVGKERKYAKEDLEDYKRRLRIGSAKE